MLSSLGQWKQFLMSTKHSIVFQVLKTVSTKFTWVSKNFVAEVNVNQAYKVNEGKILFIEFTWSPKDFVWFVVLTELLMVNIGNHFWNNVYRARSANEGIC